ncbi:MAG TPA: hypothetical protein PLR41_07015 [Alphaproteobacteria bacterium]|nr:hypothetical protein [Alphaproteobacteria bacterium]
MAELSRASPWAAFLADLARGEAPALIARRFDETLADAVATLAWSLAERSGAGLVALSGGGVPQLPAAGSRPGAPGSERTARPGA